MPRTKRTLLQCQTLDRYPKFSNRSSETQYKCSQGDPFEKVWGGGYGGVGCAEFQGGTRPATMRMQNRSDGTQSA